jgi:hypothetical protein
MESLPLSLIGTFLGLTLATVGITNSFVLSRYNERKLEKRAILRRCAGFAQRRLENARGETNEYLEKAIEVWNREINDTEPLRAGNWKAYISLLPFSLFLISFISIYLIDNFTSFFQQIFSIERLELIIHSIFMLGIFSLAFYIAAITLLLHKYLQLSTSSNCSLNMTFAKPKSESKEIKMNLENSGSLDVDIIVNGTVTNGFFDTEIIYDNEQRVFSIWNPDRATYLSSFSYSKYGILLIDPNYDTGVLQGKLENQQFTLHFRIWESAKTTSHSKMGDEIVLDDYLLPQKGKMRQLKIRFFVDPLFYPDIERIPLDELVITNIEN